MYKHLLGGILIFGCYLFKKSVKKQVLSPNLWKGNSKVNIESSNVPSGPLPLQCPLVPSLLSVRKASTSCYTFESDVTLRTHIIMGKPGSDVGGGAMSHQPLTPQQRPMVLCAQWGARKHCCTESFFSTFTSHLFYKGSENHLQ